VKPIVCDLLLKYFGGEECYKAIGAREFGGLLGDVGLIDVSAIRAHLPERGLPRALELRSLGLWP
jgi:hypothetical protein